MCYNEEFLSLFFVHLLTYFYGFNCMLFTFNADETYCYIFFFSVSLLKDLPEEKLAKIIDCLEVVSFQHFIVSIALLFVGNAYLFLK